MPQQRSALLPQISGSLRLSDTEGGSAGLTQFPTTDGSVQFGPASEVSDGRGRTSQLTLNQSIYDHRNYTRLRAAKDRSQASAADYDRAADALMLRVSEAYFNVLTAIDSRGVATVTLCRPEVLNSFHFIGIIEPDLAWLKYVLLFGASKPSNR
mgnify:CR=1 FL=1